MYWEGCGFKWGYKGTRWFLGSLAVQKSNDFFLGWLGSIKTHSEPLNPTSLNSHILSPCSVCHRR